MEKELRIALLTGGNDPPYVLPFAASLAGRGIQVDFIGNDEMAMADQIRNKNIRYFDLRGNMSEDASLLQKIVRIIRYYFALLNYAARTETRIFHIQWLNKFELFDRSMLNLFYKVMGKRLVFTAHNVNAGTRDRNDGILNRLSLWVMYRLMDHIFVHTTKMKTELCKQFHVPDSKVTIIPFGLNIQVPASGVSSIRAREALGIKSTSKILLFFGQIAPYKGLDTLLNAFKDIVNIAANDGDDIFLVIAGKIKKGFEQYWSEVEHLIRQNALNDRIIRFIGFIPDSQVENFFAACDVVILPYRNVYQTGVLFLAYRFGVPVVATDVGNFREDILDGITGFVCLGDDSEAISTGIRKFFSSNLYHNAELTRARIREYAERKYSWNIVGQRTEGVYRKLCAS
jgi:D-inositol-3-phosphate glycosyltransferase